MKRTLAFILVLIMVLTFGACSGPNDFAEKESSDSTNNSTESNSNSAEDLQSNMQDTSINTTENDLVDETKIQHDLTTEQGHIFYLNNQATPLIFESINIQRRKTNGDYDEIHIAAVLSDIYYTVNTEYILYYSYYTVGGWCLDRYETKSYESKATASPVTDDAMVTYLLNHFSSAQVTDRIQSTTPTGAYCETVYFTSTLKYNYLTVNFSGWYKFEFYDHCWYETYDFELTSYDWSAFEGTFRCTGNIYWGDIDIKLTLSNIEQISEEKLQLTYSGNINLYDKYGSISANKEVPETKKVLSTSTSAKTTVFGKDFSIPYCTADFYLYLPIANLGEEEIQIRLYRDFGVGADDLIYNGYTEYFDKLVSEEELQDALDRLNGLNP